MKVRVFGGLKEYFEPEFQLAAPFPLFVFELKQLLKDRNPESVELLKKCRFAVSNRFVSEDFELVEVQEILVMPPSSGG